MKVSSVVLSTQLRPAAGRNADNPLVRDGVELVPNLTHIVGRNQKMYFYYEVYDPGAAEGAPAAATSLAFYRGKVKVFETPVVERTRIDAADRQGARLQFEVPAGRFKPGLYTCQVNIIDEVAGKLRVSAPRALRAISPVRSDARRDEGATVHWTLALRTGPSHLRTGPSHLRTGPSHLRPVAPSDRTLLEIRVYLTGSVQLEVAVYLDRLQVQCANGEVHERAGRAKAVYHHEAEVGIVDEHRTAGHECRFALR